MSTKRLSLIKPRTRAIYQLIKKNNNFCKFFKSKIKINSLLNQYDTKADGEFKNIVHLSSKRYKKGKRGNFNETRENFQVLSNFSEEFLHKPTFMYNSDVREEKKNFVKFKTKPHDDITTLIRKIKTNSYDFKGNRRHICCFDYFEQKKRLDEGEKIMLKTIDDEQKEFNEKIGDYLGLVNEKKNESRNSSSNSKITFNYDFAENSKMLNFKPLKIERPKQEEMTEPNVNKISMILKEKYTPRDKKEEEKQPYTSRNSSSKYHDTIVLLQQEAMKNSVFPERMKKMRERIDNLVDNGIPNYSEYETILKKRRKVLHMTKSSSENQVSSKRIKLPTLFSHLSNL